MLIIKKNDPESYKILDDNISDDNQERRQTPLIANKTLIKLIFIFGIIIFVNFITVLWIFLANSYQEMHLKVFEENNFDINDSTININVTTTNNTNTDFKTVTSISRISKDSSILCGKWKSSKSDNFDEYLKAIGVSYFKRQYAVNSNPIMTIAKNDLNWYIEWRFTLPFGITVSNVMNCTNGVEFDLTTADGRFVRSVVTEISESEILQEEKDPKTKKLISLTTFQVNDNDQLITLTKFGDVSTTRTYVRI